MWGWLPLAAGVAVTDAVSAASGIDARLKWPNDVLVGGGKLAGILAEAVPTRGPHRRRNRRQRLPALR